MPEGWATCKGCNGIDRLFSYRVVVVQKTKTKTYTVTQCADCARGLIDAIESAASEKSEMTHAG